MFENDRGIYRPVWCGALSLLPKTQSDIVAYLDWAASSGFNGVRVFAGELGWSKPERQTLQLVYDRLPFVIDEGRKRGLYVEVTALTDTANGYNVEDHIKRIREIVSDKDNVIVELANEPYHGTQADKVHSPAYLAGLRQSISSLTMTALGASADDENDEFSAGDFVTVHLDRGRDKWNMVRRVRELENLSAKVNKPVMNNEAIKFGSQMNDPAIAFTMGVLNRGFEIGGVLHCDDALNAAVPFTQQAFADAWVSGSKCIKTDARLRFVNATWADSPVASADFDTRIVRAYSFVSPDQSVLVEVGVVGDGGVQFKNGWSRGDLIAEMSDNENSRKCRVFNIVRG